MTDIQLRDFETALRKRVKGNVSFDEMTRGIYSTDASIYQIMPVAVVEPRDEADVQAVVALAREFEVPLLPRGGGTSLGGQSCGPSLVMDFTKHMADVIELNVAERWARVQPGIVLDELNAILAADTLLFAPDPATSSRATIGGMMGNNSSGTRSIVYGLTCDHVLEMKVLLSDGTVVEFKALSSEEYAERAAGKSREAELLSTFKKIVETNREAIQEQYPKVLRRVQGYNLDSFVNGDRWNLAKIMVGSEGTLGVVLEAKLNLEPVPKHKSLCVIQFDELMKAIRAVVPILKQSPSAVEILDEALINLGRNNRITAPLCEFMEGDPTAILMVEFFGDSADDARAKADGLASDMQRQGIGYAWPVMITAADQAKIWKLRKSGLGLLLGMKGHRKPLPFIEDCGIPVEVLAEYVQQILDYCKSRDVGVAMYAHASVGTIHIRPILDLKLQEDIDHLKAISEYTFNLAKGYGGSWSGEHGDGRVRSPFLERFFGERVYGALREVKQLFDPMKLMNPGPIIDPNPQDQDLRYGTEYKTPTEPTQFHYRESGSFSALVETCNGVGACRQRLAGTMCPSFRATRDETHSTRGRANALRLAMSGQLGAEGLTDRRVFEVMDLCLSCKACKTECPSNVDVARLKCDFLQVYRDKHGVTFRDGMIAKTRDTAEKMSGWKAPIVNAIQKTGIFRAGLDMVAGFDKRRKPPAFARQTFGDWFADRPARAPVPHARDANSGRKVVLFDDTYIKFYEPNIGISAVELLESCGYEVIVAEAGCCQRPKISNGFLRDAKGPGEATLRNLDTWIAQGLDVVVCEPSCCSALTDDLPDLIDDEALGERIQAHVMMIDVFLAREIASGALDCSFTSQFKKLTIHGHCHQKALFGTTAMQDVLGKATGVTVDEVEAGCCGMAGAFGYEKEHYDLSMQIGEDRLFPAMRKVDNDTRVVACGFSCRHQIADGTNVKAVHWVETLRGNA